MAEFRLGRIRFVWKEDWTPNTSFLKDDIVRHGGKTYLCIATHTSSTSFAQDLESYWNTLSEGQEWKGDWISSNLYKVNDVVKNGGYLYIANTEHTSAPSSEISITNVVPDSEEDLVSISFADTGRILFEEGQTIEISNVVSNGDPNNLYNGTFTVASATTSSVTIESSVNDSYVEGGSIVLGLESDRAKWDLYAEGFDYKEEWTTDNTYNVNDIVKYGSTIYICTKAHVSALTGNEGLEADIDKWDIFSKGLDWKGDWQPLIRYRRNDIVRYGGIIYVANEGHLSAETFNEGLEADQSKWNFFHKGVDYRGEWVAGARFRVNDLVKYGSGIWICVQQHISGSDLTDDESKWNQFVDGLEFEDSWNSSERYQIGDVVSFGGYVYTAISNNTNVKPIDSTADWELFSTGFRFVGEYAEDSVTQEYEVGDVVRLGGYSYLCIKTHETSERPPNTEFWAELNPGIEWKDAWTDGAFYDAGDAVSLTFTDGDEVTNSYICILAHIADEGDEQNRPDQDTNGIYWSLLSGGPENNVLGQVGDLLYYSGTGPAALPLGDPGQVLRVRQDETAPEWAYVGQINNIVYVEPQEGKDEPAPIYGSTIDQPFKTIRYATSQIDNGILRPDARKLIELNTAFIQNETLRYVNEKITAQEAGTIWEGFTNDEEFLTLSEFYEVIDVVLYDLTHAGNAETRRQTLTYFDSGSLITEMANENEQFVDALVYMQTVIDPILRNVPVSTTISFSQTFTSSDAESDALTVIESLFDIITNALLAEDTTNLPAVNIPNSTVFVKTGTMKEVLPIIVPENCAVAGDELRSTRIEPAEQIVEASDVTYSLDAISRLQTIIDPIVTGDEGAFTASSGNTETYVVTDPVLGSAQAGEDAAELFQQISDYIDWGINGVTGDSTEPKTAGSNIVNNNTGYTYAVEAIEKNRAFLIEEAIAFIKAENPSYEFNESACRRDIDRYISAVQYDLLYTGNYKSLLAAKYYVNSVLGSTAEDMFYMRNGTGLRNCTVAGLTGTLSAENEFGTKRPTAGAYVSLDPGWGPDDERVWIKARSPYVQNVTTFGTGCVGCKIDGDLHNGGNDSIVANDFTQVISDGIGAWCTNLGRTELVSVFSYYAHIGYLAENGGKIRATNGNSSYGTFGTVAEGVDGTEIPTIGQVDNRAFEASVNRVFTTGDQILTFEYSNAGQNYTSGGTEFIVTGEGFNAELDTPQTVDGGVFEVRMLDTDVTGDGEGDFGGDNYFTSQNAAQGGNATSITLSNTEVAIPSQLFGLAIFIASGLGAGQYGVIAEYNSGTKIAQIGDSAVGVIETTAVDASTGEITVATTAELSAGDNIRFTGTEFGGLDSATVYVIDTVVSATAITLVSPGTLTTETGLMFLYRPGWDVLVPGVVSVETNLDASTSYLIEPRVVIDPPRGADFSTFNDIQLNNSTNLSGLQHGVFFKPDGRRVYATDQGDSLLQADLDIAWDITSIDDRPGISLKTVDLGLPGVGAYGLYIGNNGQKLYIAVYVDNDNGEIREYDLSTPYDITTASYTGNILSIAERTFEVTFKPDGTKMFVLAIGFDSITEYDLSTAWDLSTASLSQTADTSPSFGGGFDFNGDGTILVLTQGVSGQNTIQKHILSTPWDISTLDPSPDAIFDFSIYGGSSQSTGIYLRNDSEKLYVNQFDNDIFEFDTLPALQFATNAAKARAVVDDEKVVQINIWDPGTGYTSAPNVTIVDPNNTIDAPTQARIGDGVLTQPTWINRGQAFETAQAEVTGDGFADQFQPGEFVRVKQLTDIPEAGSNIVFGHLPNKVFKVVVIRQLLGTGEFGDEPPFSAQLQVSPELTISEAAPHETEVELRIRFSQVRLTGHDFLDIGTGNKEETNYPNEPEYDPDPEAETRESDGGRVFYTSTDQDGNFRVGELFSIEQSTGVATLNADAFNISGLNELSLGQLGLGGTGVTITEFSADGTFAADSDSVVPTQKAIKTFITSQIGGGAASLNVNSITAGEIQILERQILTTTGNQIVVEQKMNFAKGIDGVPAALNFFLSQ